MITMSASCSRDPDSRRSARLRHPVLALLGVAAELRQRDHRHLQLLGEKLDLARELRDLQLPGLHLLARGHQLDVIDADQLEVVALFEATGLGADLHHRQIGGVVDEQRFPGEGDGAGR